MNTAPPPISLLRLVETAIGHARDLEAGGRHVPSYASWHEPHRDGCRISLAGAYAAEALCVRPDEPGGPEDFAPPLRQQVQAIGAADRGHVGIAYGRLGELACGPDRRRLARCAEDWLDELESPAVRGRIDGLRYHSWDQFLRHLDQLERALLPALGRIEAVAPMPAYALDAPRMTADAGRPGAAAKAGPTSP